MSVRRPYEDAAPRLVVLREGQRTVYPQPPPKPRSRHGLAFAGLLFVAAAFGLALGCPTHNAVQPVEMAP